MSPVGAEEIDGTIADQKSPKDHLGSGAYVANHIKAGLCIQGKIFYWMWLSGTISQNMSSAN